MNKVSNNSKPLVMVQVHYTLRIKPCKWGRESHKTVDKP